MAGGFNQGDPAIPSLQCPTVSLVLVAFGDSFGLVAVEDLRRRIFRAARRPDAPSRTSTARVRTRQQPVPALPAVAGAGHLQGEHQRCGLRVLPTRDHQVGGDPATDLVGDRVQVTAPPVAGVLAVRDEVLTGVHRSVIATSR
jgi:hypothetical protein